MILLDTHVLVWLSKGNEKLGEESRQLIDEAFAEGNLGVSAISFWKIAMLQQKGRLHLAGPPSIWRKRLLDYGLIELPVTGGIGIAATTLTNLHPDRADRIIIATGDHHSAILITADRKILTWNGNLKRYNAEK